MRWIAGLGLAALLSLSAQAQTYEIKINAKKLQKEAAQESLRKTLTQRLEEPILKSTVCIRGTEFYTTVDYNPLTKEPQLLGQLAKYHGTGNVIDTQVVNGNVEYIITTNKHVGKAQEYMPHASEDGTLNFSKLQSEKLTLVENAWDNDESDDIRLELLGKTPDGDGAILRTVHAPKKVDFSPFKVQYDFESTVKQGDEIVTAGFPYGRGKSLYRGIISNTDLFQWTLTPYPLNAITADIRIDGGQSGSSVYMIKFRKKGSNIIAYPVCIGLIYGKNKDDDSTRMITPAKALKQLLEMYKDVPTKRPQLDEPVVSADEFINGTTTYDFRNRRYVLEHKENDVVVKEYIVRNNLLIENNHLDTTLSVTPNGLRTKSITYVQDEKKKSLDVTPENENLYDITYTAMFNHFKTLKHLQKVQSVKNSNVKNTQDIAYYFYMTNENANIVFKQWLAMHTQLYMNKVIGDEFW